MKDYELPGAFYLGRQTDGAEGGTDGDLLMVDSRNLTTHAVIVGMTGSGKTGLGISLLEEALIDRIPVIAIDPKGDIANLALQFPSLDGKDFEPWVDPQQAAAADVTVSDWAEQQAALWKKGLAQWGQSGDRIQRLKDCADITVYTPGSNAGVQLSALRAFDPPSDAILNDDEAFGERVSSTTTGLLTLLGVEADPVSGREHILVSSILSANWREGRATDLPSLITSIQNPPFSQLGVMPVETVFPSKDRLALAMRLNNLLASPGFQQWMKGDAIDTSALLYTPSGKPRASVISIAHLSDAERMFVVTLLLSDIIAWMRSQPGTGSLRAILYIDELFGYMPPVANPPSKQLLLTLLKQARAFGLGVVLATQNPVDLDYRGLSNAGTWFIGRLQTERDKLRLLDGLEGAATSDAFKRADIERTIAGLGKRRFLLHSVHDASPVEFSTRWVLSYLAGPMTREQIRQLRAISGGGVVGAGAASASVAVSGAQSAPAPAATATPGSPTPSVATTAVAATGVDAAPAATGTPDASPHAPVLSAEIPQYFLNTSSADRLYRPHIIGVADVTIANTRYNVAEDRRIMLLGQVSDGPVAFSWTAAEPRDGFDITDMEKSATPGALFVPVPAEAALARNYTAWGKQLQQWLARNESVELLESAKMKLVSRSDESERDFRIRLQNTAREARDIQIEKLRAKYASKLVTAQEKIRRSEQAVQREQAQAQQAHVSTVVAVGSAMLGAFLGRGKISATSISKLGTAARGAGRSVQQQGDVARAAETVNAQQQQLAVLEEDLQREIDALDASYDAQAEELKTITVKPKQSDVRIRFVGLLWVA